MLNNCWFSVCIQVGTSSARALETLVAVLLVVNPSPIPLRQFSFMFFSSNKMIAHSISDRIILSLQGSLDSRAENDRWTSGVVFISCRRQQTSLNFPRHREIRAPDL